MLYFSSCMEYLKKKSGVNLNRRPQITLQENYLGFYLVVFIPLSVMVGHAWPFWHKHLGLTIYSPGLAVMSLQYWVALQGGSWGGSISGQF